MTTPLFRFSNDPKSIPISTNTSWDVVNTPEPKYKIIPQDDGQLTLRRTLSHMSRAYKDAEPFMDKCKQDDAILINWYAHPTYHEPQWYNFLYEPYIHVTYCYLRKHKDNIFHEYIMHDQEYDTINPFWKYSVSPLPSKKSIIGNDRYTSLRIIIWRTILLLNIFIILRIFVFN
jgi:hypothetical protein